MNQQLFPPGFLRLLDFGSMPPMNRVGGGKAGRHLASAVGDSLEFQDFRTYSPGDDMRYLDWNIFRRTGKLFLKRYRHFPETDHLITLDGSNSIRFSCERAYSAWRVAALLGACLLRGGDRVTLGDGLEPEAVFHPGAEALWAWCELLSRRFDRAKEDQGEFVLAERRARRHWVISDFYDSRGMEHLARRLRAGNFTPVRIFERAELEPLPAGDFSLVDAESAERMAIHSDATVLARYRERMAHFEGLLRDCAQRAHGKLYQVETALDYRQTVANFHREFFNEEA